MSNNSNGDNGNSDVDLSQLANFIHSTDSTEKAFKASDNTNAINLMYLTDAEFMNNLMRLDLPNNQVILAMAGIFKKCKAHNYTDGMEWLQVLMSLLTSRRAKRTNQVVEAITGDRKWKEQGGNGAMDALKNFSFGKKE